MKYDLLVIGDTPAAWEGALTAARMGKTAAVLVPHDQVAGRLDGWESLCTEWLDDLGFDEAQPNVRRSIQARLADDLGDQLAAQRVALQGQLVRYGIPRIVGDVAVTGRHEVRVHQGANGTVVCEGARILVATGADWKVPAAWSKAGAAVITPDRALELPTMNRHLFVIGGGAWGLWYARLLARFGARVTIVDGDSRCLAGMQAAELGPQIDVQLGADVLAVEPKDGRVELLLETGDRLQADGALIAIGRTGRTRTLNLIAAGIQTDEDRRIWCNGDLRTWQPHIYACGAVVGYGARRELPAAAARRAVLHAFATSQPLATRPVPAAVRSAARVELLCV